MSDDSLFRFPCDIPIKVFGRNRAAFREAAVGIVRDHYEDLDDTRIHERASRGGKYLSLTITVVAESRDQIDAVYRELSAHADVLMVL